MHDVLDALATLADHPPRPAPLLSDIRHRAATRRRRRHRRSVIAAVAAVAVVAGTASLVRAEERRPVATDEHPPSTSESDTRDGALSRSPDGDRVLDRPLGLVLDPAADLPASAEVEVTLPDDPGGQLVAVQCLADIVAVTPAERLGALGGLCGELQFERTGGRLTGVVAVEVRRRLVVAETMVDCAAAPGRCVVAVRPGTERSVGDDRFAPLAFASTGPLPTPTLILPPSGRFADGAPVEVVGRGFVPGDEVALRQCLDEGAGTRPVRCDAEARTRRVTVDVDGSFTVDVTLYRDVGVGDSADGRTVTWTACDPCVLDALGGGIGSVTTPISMAPTATPIHPRIRIVPEGPHAPGQVVRVEGSGFAPTAADGTRIDLLFCATAGEPGQCVYPTGDPTVPIVPAVAADGRFVVEDLVLPTDGTIVFGADCAAQPSACALVWQDSFEGAAFGQVVPLDLTG